MCTQEYSYRILSLNDGHTNVVTTEFLSEITILFVSDTVFLSTYAVGVSGQFITASPTCPGDPFTFSCTVVGNRNGVTIWRVNIGGTYECPLSHIVTGNVQCGPDNEFTATPRTEFGPGTSATSFSSTLSVGTATLALDGTLVECFGPDFFSRDAENRVGNGTIWIIG